MENINLILLLVIVLLASLVGVLLVKLKNWRSMHTLKLGLLEKNYEQDLLQVKTEIQEETLRHIARELHDNFNQVISVIKLTLSVVRNDGSEKDKIYIAQCISLADNLIEEIRTLGRNLNSEYVGEIGLRPAIENLVRQVKNSGNFQINYAVKGKEYRLKPGQETILFRICQETFNNIMKHSRATSIDISIDYHEAFLELKIRDNGVGFDLQRKLGNSSVRGSGLVNIQNRAKLINAGLVFMSEPGKGTTVSITVTKTDR